MHEIWCEGLGYGVKGLCDRVGGVSFLVFRSRV